MSRPDRLSYDVAEAAEAASVSPWAIREAYRSGALTVRYHGTKVLILVDDLRAWLESLPTERSA